MGFITSYFPEFKVKVKVMVMVKVKVNVEVMVLVLGTQIRFSENLVKIRHTGV